MIKKADIVLLILIVVMGLIISFGPLKKASGGTDVRITCDGELFGIYDLNTDQTVTIDRDGHQNVVVIEDGTVYMQSSTCHNHICMDKASL